MTSSPDAIITMQKTPIKIPGKNNRDTRKAAVLARKALNRPRGRPLKLTSSKQIERIPAANPKKQKKRSMKNLKSRHKMSDLEKLPTELLEKVFLYCLNLELPRSSPVIGGKLSTESIYMKTILAGFGPTWDACYGLRREWNTQLLSGPGDSVFQSGILRCRWANLSLLLKAQDVWSKKHSTDRIFQAVSFDSNQEREEAGLESDEALRKTPSEYFEEDFTLFSNMVQSRDLSILENSSWDTYVSVADGIEIPHSLLLGPWTEDTIRYLYWMVKSGSRLEWITSTVGEVALLGLKNAISAGNIRAIHLLQWVGLFDKVDLENLLWALQNAGGDRLTVMEPLLSMGPLSRAEAEKFRAAMDEFRDKAEREADEANLAFINNLKKSQALPWA